MLITYDNELRSVREFEDRVVVFSEEEVLTDELVPKNKNFILRARNVLIKGDIKAAGINLTILAETIEISSEITIDLSGTTGSPDWSEVPKAITPLASPAGTNGIKGEDGGTGSDGGNLQLLARNIVGLPNLKVDCGGGIGGRGQDGGDGRPGVNGTDGGNNYKNCNGTNGGNGGNGGEAGKSGDGGTGGTIIIRSLVNVDNSSEKFIVAGGNGAETTSHGEPNKKGTGGKPGYYVTERSYGPNGHNDTYTVKHHCGGGRDGRDGIKPSSELYSPINGIDGEISVASGLLENEYGKLASIEYLQLLLHHAELYFINQEYEKSINTLEWIFYLSDSTELRVEERQSSKDPSKCTDVQCNTDQLDSIRSSAALMLSRIEYGLDFDGNPRNWIPTSTVPKLRDRIDRYLQTVESIENSIRLYDSLESEQNLMEELNKALEAHENEIIQLNESLEGLSKDLSGLALEVTLLDKKLQSQWEDFILKRRTFLEAVARKEACKRGVAVLRATAMLCAAVYTFGASSASAIGAISDVSDTYSSLKKLGKIGENVGFLDYLFSKEGKEFKNIIVKSGKEIGESYKEIVSEIGELRVDSENQLPNDRALIIAKRDEIEKQLDAYSNMSSAENFKAALRVFVDTSLARNEKAHRHDSLALKSIEYVLQGDIHSRSIADIRTQIAVEAQPDQARIRMLMSHIWIFWKKLVIKEIRSLDRLVEYLTFIESGEHIDSRRLATLRNSYGIINQKYDQYQDGTRLDEQKYGINSGLHEDRFSLSLREYFGPDNFSALKTKKSMVISVPKEFFDGLWGERCSGVSLAAVDKNGNSLRTEVKLTHLGQSVVKDSNGEFAQFSHRYRFRIFETDETNVFSMTIHANEYIGISPYGPWLLTLRSDSTVDIFDLVLNFQVVALELRQNGTSTLLPKINT